MLGLRLQVHAGEAEYFAPSSEVAALLTAANEASVDARVFSYLSAGHFYTNAWLTEYDARAAASWAARRILRATSRAKAVARVQPDSVTAKQRQIPPRGSGSAARRRLQ